MLQILVLCLVVGSSVSQDVPQISVNDVLVSDQSELVVPSGSALSVSCHGDGPLSLRSSSLMLMYHSLGDRLRLHRSQARHTGTYTCVRPTNQSTELSTSVHLYVSDLSEPFVVTRSRSSAVEGEDYLIRCLPTAPDITHLTVQSERREGHADQSQHSGMEVTFDPHRGALIRKVQRSFQGSYRCKGQRHGQEVMSPLVDLWVQLKLVAPPSLSVTHGAATRLVGEKFEVTCLCTNQNHFFNLTWTHPSNQLFSEFLSQSYSGSRVYKNRTLVLTRVQTSDTGVFTCTAVNEAGVSTATTHLSVTDQAFVRVYLRLHNDSSELIANGSMPLMGGANTTVGGANTIVGGANITMGGAKVPVGGVTQVQVDEGRDLSLLLLFEAYPPIRTLRWSTPENSTVYTEPGANNANDANGANVANTAQMVIGRVHRSDSGLYRLFFSNQYFSGNLTVNIRVHYAPDVKLWRQDSELVCLGSGFPPPALHWTSCHGLTERCENASELDPSETWSRPGPDPEDSEDLIEDSEDLIEDSEDHTERALSLPLSHGDDITVVCTAVNHMGQSHDLLQIREPEPLLSPLLIGLCSVALLFLLLLLVSVWKWRQKPRYEIRWKIIESSDGNNYSFIDPTLLPYDQALEFPRHRLKLGAVLGAGAFGKVVAATALGLESEHQETTVAVKMLKPRALSEERDALMSELKILSHLGFHHNIVNLLGACTTGGPMLMITEYCCHGDLLNFLRTRAHHFLCDPEVLYNNSRLRSDSGISCGSDYTEMKTIINPRPGLDLASDGGGLSLLDLVRFSLDVAQGLDFLSSRNCIHRDVAARNVLVTERRIAKICDFGLARDIRHDDSYIVKGNARLPVKWMSPESIFLCVYTVQSDVWSYAVLLWEVFSLGRNPYPNVAVDTNFYRMIKNGRHMDRPDFAPTEIYDLMKHCWDLEPTLRPTFNAIGQIISRLLPSTNQMPPPHTQQVTYTNINEEDKPNHRDEVSEVDHEKPVTNIYQLS